MTAATPNWSRPGSWAGWAARPGRGWWSWMTCGTRRTWTACCRAVPAGRVLITAADAEAVPGARQVAVPAFSLREAMAYLFGRLTTDPDQRSGAYDLAEHLGGEPAALAQAGAVMAGVGRRLPRLPALLRRAAGAAAGGRRARAARPPRSPGCCRRSMPRSCCPAAGPGRCCCSPRCWTATGFPVPVLTAPGRLPVPRRTPAPRPPDPQHARSAVAALEHAGLVAAGPARAA